MAAPKRATWSLDAVSTLRPCGNHMLPLLATAIIAAGSDAGHDSVCQGQAQLLFHRKRQPVQLVVLYCSVHTRRAMLTIQTTTRPTSFSSQLYSLDFMYHFMRSLAGPVISP